MEPLRVVNGVRREGVANPCALVLLSKGYKLSLVFARAADADLAAEYTAEKDGVRITAGNAVELLGLVAMWEARGPDWREKRGEPFVYEILYSESFIREPDGRLVENPERWFWARRQPPG